MYEEESVALSTRTQIINTMAFVALCNLDSFVTVDKVKFYVEIEVCLYINISLSETSNVIT